MPTCGCPNITLTNSDDLEMGPCVYCSFMFVIMSLWSATAAQSQSFGCVQKCLILKRHRAASPTSLHLSKFASSSVKRSRPCSSLHLSAHAQPSADTVASTPAKRARGPNLNKSVAAVTEQREHKWKCGVCKRNITGKTRKQLSANRNSHVDIVHKGEPKENFSQLQVRAQLEFTDLPQAMRKHSCSWCGLGINGREWSSKARYKCLLRHIKQCGGPKATVALNRQRLVSQKRTKGER